MRHPLRAPKKSSARRSAGARPAAAYAMDVEFKFEGAPGETPQLYIKQARPHGQE